MISENWRLEAEFIIIYWFLNVKLQYTANAWTYLFSPWLEICECSVGNDQDPGFVDTLDICAYCGAEGDSYLQQLLSCNSLQDLACIVLSLRIHRVSVTWSSVQCLKSRDSPKGRKQKQIHILGGMFQLYKCRAELWGTETLWVLRESRDKHLCYTYEIQKSANLSSFSNVCRSRRSIHRRLHVFSVFWYSASETLLLLLPPDDALMIWWAAYRHFSTDTCIHSMNANE